MLEIPTAAKLMEDFDMKNRPASEISMRKEISLNRELGEIQHQMIIQRHYGTMDEETKCRAKKVLDGTYTGRA